jgi:hypothetical protein
VKDLSSTFERTSERQQALGGNRGKHLRSCLREPSSPPAREQAQDHIISAFLLHISKDLLTSITCITNERAVLAQVIPDTLARLSQAPAEDIAIATIEPSLASLQSVPSSHGAIKGFL